MKIFIIMKLEQFIIVVGISVSIGVRLKMFIILDSLFAIVCITFVVANKILTLRPKRVNKGSLDNKQVEHVMSASFEIEVIKTLK